MASVEIFSRNGRTRVVVDGTDITEAITDGGLNVEWPEGGARPLVHVTIRARQLDLDLSEAGLEVVEALLPGRHPDPVTARP